MGTNRCGTTYLFRLLKDYMSIPDELAHDEPYAEAIMHRSTDRDEALALFNKALDRTRNALLMKDHAQTLSIVSDMYGTQEKYTAFSDDVYKIKVVRLNFKQAVISMAIARTTDLYHYSKEKSRKAKRKMRIVIDKELFINCLDIMVYGFNELHGLPDELFDEVIIYEDLIGDPMLDQRLIALTSGDIRTIELDMVKSPPQKTVVVNYDEVCEWYETEIAQRTHENFTIVNGFVSLD